MNREATKECPYCAEQIRIAAKICPRCRQWQRAFSLRNPASLIIALSLWGLILIAGLVISFRQVFHSGLDFSPYRNNISVVESQMNFGNEDKEPLVYVVTVITNNSDLAWKDVELDARFFNKAGTLIDAQPWREYLTILPHEDTAFRIRMKPSHELADYQSYKVFVRSARDVHSRF